MGQTGSCSNEQDMLSKSLTQFSADGLDSRNPPGKHCQLTLP